MLFLTLERSYVSLRVFLCQVKFMRKGISKETLAHLCCCDTSSIYLVTSWREDPIVLKKYQWQLFVRTSKCAGKWVGIVQVLHGMLALTDRCSCRNCGNFVGAAGRSPSVQCKSQGWDPRSWAGADLLVLTFTCCKQSWWLLTTKFSGCGAMEVPKSSSWVSVHELSGVHDLILTVGAAVGLIRAEKL